MSEAERMEDYGEILLIEELRERQNHIIDIKIERLHNLIGKYVITSTGKGSKRLYLQDRNISKDFWWTNFLDCAFGFKSEVEASRRVEGYKYNNPKVVRVTEDMVNYARESMLKHFEIQEV